VGRGVESRICRRHEVGRISEATYRRASASSGCSPATRSRATGEVPALLPKAYTVAVQHGLTTDQLAGYLKITQPRLRLLLANQTPDPACILFRTAWLQPPRGIQSL
jgi:hypothetical protein